jgi:hypothetical protein
MKRSFFLILILLCSVLTLAAQKNLAVNELFNSPEARSGKLDQVRVEGKQLKPYQLTLYRSLTIPSGTTVYGRVEGCIRADSEKAYTMEIGRSEGRISYAFLCIAGEDINRYVFYRHLKPAKSKAEAAIVYMEGYASLDELKTMFKKPAGKEE